MRELLQGNYYQNKDYVFCHDDGKLWHPRKVFDALIDMEEFLFEKIWGRGIYHNKVRE